MRRKKDTCAVVKMCAPTYNSTEIDNTNVLYFFPVGREAVLYITATQFCSVLYYETEQSNQNDHATAIRQYLIIQYMSSRLLYAVI